MHSYTIWLQMQLSKYILSSYSVSVSWYTHVIAPYIKLMFDFCCSGFSSSHVWYYTKDTISKAIKCWMVINIPFSKSFYIIEYVLSKYVLSKIVNWTSYSFRLYTSYWEPTMMQSKKKKKYIYFNSAHNNKTYVICNQLRETTLYFHPCIKSIFWDFTGHLPDATKGITLRQHTYYFQRSLRCICILRKRKIKEASEYS